MPNIFISYRRDDAPANARLVYERLREWFGEGNSFMDVEQIALGDDWKHVLDLRVTRCDALLAVIGPHWLTAASSDGRRRLDDPEDFVRWEIRAALTRGKRVIPVLVDGAPLPRVVDLPPDLASLAGLQAQTVTHAFDRCLIWVWVWVCGRLSNGAGLASHSEVPREQVCRPRAWTSPRRAGRIPVRPPWGPTS